MGISSISSGTSVGWPVDNTAANSTENSSPIVETRKSPTSTTVQISGKALLYSRIFGTTDLSKELYIETEVGTTKGQSVRNGYYLSGEDREILASIYEYASENNINLEHVDRLAGDLARFREWGWVPYADLYTVDGRKVTADFTAEDKEIANRIKNSDAFASTKLDREFLDNILDSRKPVHGVKFDFLEHVVSVFSNDGVPKNSVDKFSTYEKTPPAWVKHISDEVDPRFVPEEPDLISINGGPYFKNPKKEVMSNEEFLESIDKDYVSKYLSLLITASFPESRPVNTVGEISQRLSDIFQGVKKSVGKG